MRPWLVAGSFLLALLAASVVGAHEFNILQYGAKPNDNGDDTLAIRAALEACGRAGGGKVFIPAGTYWISRQKSETPILELPSNTIVCGEGPASILKFDPRVNQSNFWRMLGVCQHDCRNLTLRDLHLDGSNTHPRYVKGTTPEQNHGVFLSRENGVIENVTIHDVLVENFSGDCIAFGHGCRNITLRDVSVRNFLRQGIQMGGGSGARDYLVTGCQELEGTVQPGGSTLHVEHARGLSNVLLADNRCLHSILASGVDGLILRNNLVRGTILGNSDRNTLCQGNVVRGMAGGAKPGATAPPLIQFGFAAGLVIRDNVMVSEESGQAGIYVWGASRYDPNPSREVTVLDNVIRVPGQPISFNGVHGGLVRDNVARSETHGEVRMSRCERITVARRPEK